MAFTFIWVKQKRSALLKKYLMKPWLLVGFFLLDFLFKIELKMSVISTLWVFPSCLSFSLAPCFHIFKIYMSSCLVDLFLQRILDSFFRVNILKRNCRCMTQITCINCCKLSACLGLVLCYGLFQKTSHQG